MHRHYNNNNEQMRDLTDLSLAAMPRESSVPMPMPLGTYRAGPVSVVKEAFRKLICQSLLWAGRKRQHSQRA